MIVCLKTISYADGVKLMWGNVELWFLYMQMMLIEKIDSYISALWEICLGLYFYSKKISNSSDISIIS